MPLFLIIFILARGFTAYLYSSIMDGNDTIQAIGGFVIMLEMAFCYAFPRLPRIHDLGNSGWYLLLALIPLVNLYLEYKLLCDKGTVGPNEYGPDPLGGAITSHN
jgi:uncharacterized membrane protein YhaH (DUF805 family)